MTATPDRLPDRRTVLKGAALGAAVQAEGATLASTVVRGGPVNDDQGYDRNRITPYARADGGGFWQINTAAHIDFPCQSRLLEITDNRDGTLSVFGTLLDAAAPLSYGGRLDSTAALASLARELSVNDPQSGKNDDSRGAVEDRNVELLVKAPFALRTRRMAPEPPS